MTPDEKVEYNAAIQLRSELRNEAGNIRRRLAPLINQIERLTIRIQELESEFRVGGLVKTDDGKVFKVVSFTSYWPRGVQRLKNGEFSECIRNLYMKLTKVE
jgi:hypothetical protein